MGGERDRVREREKHARITIVDTYISREREMGGERTGKIRVMVAMDTWSLLLLLLLLSLSLCFALKILLPSAKKRRLPPGPPSFPFIGSRLKKPSLHLEHTLRDLRAEYGPIVTLHLDSRPSIFIADRHLAHQALVQKGAAFADRPPPLPHDLVLTSNQHNITSAGYSPLWRLLRRNLASQLFHPSRLKLFAGDRRWVLGMLFDSLRAQSGTGDGAVVVHEAFDYAMFCLLAAMCFGGKLGEEVFRDIKGVQRDLQLSFLKFRVFAFLPRITKLLFRKRWSEFMAIRRRQEEIFVPLIRARRDQVEKGGSGYSYVDSLLGLQLPEEGGRGLTEGEMVGLCSELLAGGTETTATSLQWIMANVVKHRNVQGKLVEEIERVVGREREAAGEGVKEEDLQKMSFLRAVILEGLRRHPPSHFVLPHAVAEEVSIGGYVIPKNASVNFLVAEVNRDGGVWEEPMEFRPERFLAGGEGEAVDITGSREIKMMPFGVGRRICPGLGLATLHLEYFVANLVSEFEWLTVEGEEVDLTENLDFTVSMKNPLRARIVARRK